MESSKYGAWLTEDLKKYYNDMLKERDRTEIYSDRADLNNLMLQVLAELQSRERNS
jgi:hypothetical protein